LSELTPVDEDEIMGGETSIIAKQLKKTILNKPSPKEQIIAEWNVEHPILGIPIDVTDDFGIVTRRVTESAPWNLCGEVVIRVSGISGGYLLERCQPVDEAHQ